MSTQQPKTDGSNLDPTSTPRLEGRSGRRSKSSRSIRTARPGSGSRGRSQRDRGIDGEETVTIDGVPYIRRCRLYSQSELRKRQQKTKQRRAMKQQMDSMTRYFTGRAAIPRSMFRTRDIPDIVQRLSQRVPLPQFDARDVWRSPRAIEDYLRRNRVGFSELWRRSQKPPVEPSQKFMETVAGLEGSISDAIRRLEPTALQIPAQKAAAETQTMKQEPTSTETGAGSGTSGAQTEPVQQPSAPAQTPSADSSPTTEPSGSVEQPTISDREQGLIDTLAERYMIRQQGENALTAAQINSFRNRQPQFPRTITRMTLGNWLASGTQRQRQTKRNALTTLLR